MKQILLPGGELENDVIAFLNKAGVDVQFKPRCYRASAKNFPIEFVIVRASSIPEIINDSGAKDVLGGITGSDILQEAGVEQDRNIAMEKLLPNFRPPVLYVGAKKEFPTLKSLSGFAIATKYPHLASTFFLKNNISVAIYYTPGKDEAIPYLRSDIVGIFGIKKTGKTLRANYMRTLSDVETCTVGWVRKPGTRQTALLQKIESTLFFS